MKIDVHLTDMQAVGVEDAPPWVLARRPGSTDAVLIVDQRLSMIDYTRLLTTVLTMDELVCAEYHYASGMGDMQSMGRTA